MSTHVLVAIDLTVESWFLLEKAENLARGLNAKLSLFYNGRINNEGNVDITYDPKFRINKKVQRKSHQKIILMNY